MIKKRMFTTLTVMAVLLSLGAVPALAESEIDQSYELQNTSVAIDVAGGYQSVSTGKTGTLDKVELLVACCGGTGMPTDDLKVTITASASPSNGPGRADTVAWIPKEEFTEDNEQNFKWVTATLDTPLPVQSTSIRSLHIYLNASNESSGRYLWAVNSPGTYSRGGYVDCNVINFGSNRQVLCAGTGVDANFRTYVTPGPDTVDPDTIDLGSPHMSGPGDTLYDQNLTSFTFASDESGVTFECSMDNAAWESCTSPKDYTGLSNGSHTLQVRALDAAGNYDETPATYQFWVQYEPPDTFINSTPSNPSNDDTPTFTFSSAPNTAFTDGRLSHGGTKGWWLPCSSPNTLNSLMESGEYTFEVRAMKSTPDFGWLFDPTPASYTWTYEDATPPSAPIITSPANNSHDNDGSFTISGTAEVGSTVELFEVDRTTGTRTAAGTPTTVGTGGNWSISLSGVVEDDHTYVAKTTDAVGNASTESNFRTVIVDSTLPAVTGKSPKPNSTGISPTANVIATFSEAMMRSSLNRSTVKLVRAGTTRAVGASISYPAPNRVVLNPTESLVRGATYRVTIVGGVSGANDLASNALAANVSWRFEVRA
jgi:hypothetical protein